MVVLESTRSGGGSVGGLGGGRRRFRGEDGSNSVPWSLVQVKDGPIF